MRKTLYDYCLETGRAEPLRSFDAEKNAPLTTRDISYGSRQKLWWRCDMGHAWQAAVYSRSSDSGCPYCAGRRVEQGRSDLASLRPDLAAQWHPEKNGDLTPHACTPASNRRAWWLCPLGHEYQAAVSARTIHGSGCPYCSGRKVLKGFNDLATREPQMAAQWHPSLNGNLTPEMVTAGSTRKVWWQCSDGHIWKAVIYSRTGPQKCACPTCSGRIKKAKLTRYQSILDAHAKFQPRITD